MIQDCCRRGKRITIRAPDRNAPFWTQNRTFASVPEPGKR